MPTIVLTPTTSAGVTPWYAVDPSRPQVVFTAPGLAGAEQAVLQHRTASGAGADTYEDGSLVAITATHSALAVVAAGDWRIAKGPTAAAVGVEMAAGG